VKAAIREHPVDAAIDEVKKIIERRAEELEALEGQELVRALASARLEARDLEDVADPRARAVLARHVGRRLFQLPAGVLHAYRAGSASKEMFLKAAVRSAFADWESLLLGEAASETRKAHVEGREYTLEQLAAEIAEELFEAYARDGLEGAADRAEEIARRVTINGRRLADVVVSDAPEDLTADVGPLMCKASTQAYTTCPGATAGCAVTCYGAFGRYVFDDVKMAAAVRTKVVTGLERELLEEARKRGLGEEHAAAVLGAFFAGALRRSKAEIVRLHDVGDLYSPVYFAAWLVAAKLSGKTIYTYTKSTPVTTPGVWRGVDLYRRLTGEEPPRNFRINVSGTIDNWPWLAEAARRMSRDVETTTVFTFVQAEAEEELKGRELEFVDAQIDAALATRGRKLILEIEHGRHRSKTAKSASLVREYALLTARRLAERGIDAFVVVPLPDAGRGDARAAELRALAEELGRMLPSEDGVYGERRVRIFKVGNPDLNTALLVFIEPAGRKQCTLCQLCIGNECRLVEAAEETAQMAAGGVVTPDRLARLAAIYRLRPDDRMDRVAEFVRRALGAGLSPEPLPDERLWQYLERTAVREAPPARRRAAR